MRFRAVLTLESTGGVGDKALSDGLKRSKRTKINPVLQEVCGGKDKGGMTRGEQA